MHRTGTLLFMFLGAVSAVVCFFRRGAHQVGVPRDMGEGLAQPKASCQHPLPTDVKHVRWLLCFADSTMILPQVHLRKPCYDFSFL